jgi:hypothetical protein
MEKRIWLKKKKKKKEKREGKRRIGEEWKWI